MSRSLASVLKTDSLKPLAQILRSKGRKGDTILAHISPKEAARLKREGGSGTINPDTGLPEFFGEEFGGGFDFGFTPSNVDTTSFAEPPVGSQMIYDQPAGPTLSEATYGPNISEGPLSGDIPGFSRNALTQGDYIVPGGSPSGKFDYSLFTENRTAGYPYSGQSTTPQAIADYIATARGDTAGAEAPRPPADIPAEGEKKAADAGKAEDKGFLDKLLSAKNLPLLALGGGGALLSAYRSQQAQSQAAKAAEQIRAAYAAAAAEQRAGAQPLLQAGGTALSQALQGTLSPANQQAMQAAQAKAAQAASQTGGVGAVQTAMSEADLRQRLLANQQSMALNLLGPANAQLSAAIQSELSGTTQGISTRLNMSQQANQAAASVYQSLATIMAAGLK
jgi:hypothetical protein